MRGFMHGGLPGNPGRSLIQMPPSLPTTSSHTDTCTGPTIIAGALTGKSDWLDPAEVL